jgi:hypothetical protein
VSVTLRYFGWFVIVLLGLMLGLGLALTFAPELHAFIEGRADHVHRYQQRLYLGQFEPYPVKCWADSHPEFAWTARPDGNCFLQDAPWLKKREN